MPTADTAQRRRTNRKKTAARVIRVQVKDRLGHARLVTADLLDQSEEGVSISLMAALVIGSTVLLRGVFAEGEAGTERTAIVKWCGERANGGFHAGLEFGSGRATQEAAHSANEETDWYEIMQLSPNADSDTVSRVYRILAQRYHPDSPTGNKDAFVLLCEAHRILGDPQLRAAYDARYRQSKELHWEIFDRPELPSRQEGEKRKRRAILEALYAKALHDPERASMSVMEMETLLGCPREHLEAACWYLRAKSYLKRSDNGRFSITVAGFDEVESSGAPEAAPSLKMLEGRVRR